MTEEWRDIEEFPGYQVSSEGRVRSLTREVARGSGTLQVPGIIFRLRVKASGYYQLSLYKDSIATTHYVHRLVGSAFIPNPDNKPTIDHVNRIKTDNSVSNLRWATHKEQNDNQDNLSNTGHKYIHLTKWNTYRVRRGKNYKTLEEAIAVRDQFYTEI
jgi:hypothetical protein